MQQFVFVHFEANLTIFYKMPMQRILTQNFVKIYFKLLKTTHKYLTIHHKYIHRKENKKKQGDSFDRLMYDKRVAVKCDP